MENVQRKETITSEFYLLWCHRNIFLLKPTTNTTNSETFSTNWPYSNLGFDRIQIKPDYTIRCWNLFDINLKSYCCQFRSFWLAIDDDTSTFEVSFENLIYRTTTNFKKVKLKCTLNSVFIQLYLNALKTLNIIFLQ